MKKISLLGFVVSFMAIMLFWMYCSKNKPTEPSYGEGIDENVKALDKLVQEPPCEETPIGDPSLDTTMIDNQQYIIKVQKYRRAAEFNEQIALDPTTDVIWPGAMIDAATIPTGQYIPITAKRAPLTLSVSLVNIAGSKSKTVTEPKLSTIREAIGEILIQDVIGATEARVTFSIENVYSEEQLKLAVGASYKSGFGNIKGQFNFSNQKIKSRILVKFMQVYYTIDIDIPEKPSDFFASSIKWDDLKSQITENTSPMYVSTITYGRMALFSFESEDKSTDVNAAISAAFWGFRGSISSEYENILQSSTIKATIIGGSGASAVAAIDGFEGIKDYILTGGNYDKNTGAAPLSYKLRHLKDNSVGNIILSSEYTIREEIPLGPLSNNELFWYRADANVTLEEEILVTNWGNSFRRGLHDATGNASFQWNPDHPSKIYTAPVLNKSGTNGRPTILTHYYWETSKNGASFSYFDYEGGLLADTSYTVFAVVKLDSGDGAWFMFNFNPYDPMSGSHEKLSVGIMPNGTFALIHGGTRLDVDHTHSNKFHIYTIIFDSENISIYIDGNLRKSAPAQKLPENRQAKIGCLNPQPDLLKDTKYTIELAEIKAYSIALNEEQRKAEEEVLYRRWIQP